jgi:hypothetical protein
MHSLQMYTPGPATKRTPRSPCPFPQKEQCGLCLVTLGGFPRRNSMAQVFASAFSLWGLTSPSPETGVWMMSSISP